MNDAHKLPRSDAKLKGLDEPVQEALWAKVCELKSAKRQQAEALPWLLAEHGVKSSTGALSDWLSWYAARLRSRARAQHVQGLLEQDRLKGFSDEELFSRGQRYMTELTIAEEDPKGWAAVQRTARDREDSQLNRQKFKRETGELFLKFYADERAREIAGNSSSTHEDKLRALDQLMFPEDWKPS